MSPAATGSSAYGSCVFFVYPVLRLFLLIKAPLQLGIYVSSRRLSAGSEYAWLGKKREQLFQQFPPGASPVTLALFFRVSEKGRLHRW